MTTKNKAVFILPVLLIGGFIAKKIFSKVQTLKSLNYNISKIDFNKKDKTIVVFLRLINAGNSVLKINNIVANILWKGVNSATIDYRNIIELKPNEEQTIQLPIKLNLSFAELVLNLIKDKTKILSGTFEIQGTINAEGLVVPLVYKRDLKLI
jgi:LEA14-like dessication related protein